MNTDPLEKDFENLTLLDYFAAKAMQGLCANSAVIFGHHRCPEHPADCVGSIAESAYDIAKAMLKQKNTIESV